MARRYDGEVLATVSSSRRITPRRVVPSVRAVRSEGALRLLNELYAERRPYTNFL
jgi:hypothetical protein